MAAANPALRLGVERVPADAADRGQAPESLALLYQGLFTGIVRLQSRRQQLPDAGAFRRRTMGTLQEIERAARSSGYDGRDVMDTHFAVVAFLDSVILNSNDPIRPEWERKTLQEELFGKTDAGVVFFEKLEQLFSRPDSSQLADILEVYLLCLLLGFQGRYSGPQRAELDGTAERLRSRIERIRGQRRELSPCGKLLEEDATAEPARPLAASTYRRYAVVAVAAMVFTAVCFLFFFWNLASMSEGVRTRLLQ